MNKLDLILLIGGVGAALALSFVCGLGLVVWLAGGRVRPPKQGALRAWRRDGIH
jgi:hypothetical protein